MERETEINGRRVLYTVIPEKRLVRVRYANESRLFVLGLGEFALHVAASKAHSA
jgi:hypothetical protein